MLEKIISKGIKQEGPITFERFMDMALYLPGYGYYMSGKSVVGPDGDFFTSPHLHPVFGWLLAIQMDEMRRFLGEPKEFTILEIGAGRGFLAEGILAYIRREFNWGDGWHYIIVERNPRIQQGQEE
ncbi:MAG: class I SAM-dependent methyltransferase, partial [Nitrospirae bacterium]|nr:class I SAM-dependent methyltransferase [Nitrospirota bacterium]